MPNGAAAVEEMGAAAVIAAGDKAKGAAKPNGLEGVRVPALKSMSAVKQVRAMRIAATEILGK
ncbi:MAG: hypothetical protein C0483_17885 [Pirellula sp.]|nr:hypothetical protein [Pirellula sp.]